MVAKVAGRKRRRTSKASARSTFRGAILVPVLLGRARPQIQRFQLERIVALPRFETTEAEREQTRCGRPPQLARRDLAIDDPRCECFRTGARDPIRLRQCCKPFVERPDRERLDRDTVAKTLDVRLALLR